MSKPSRRRLSARCPPKNGVPGRGRQITRRSQASRRRWVGVGIGALGAIIAIIVAATATPHPTRSIALGAPAPGGTFTTSTGATRTVSSLTGQPTLLWFVSTWCSSCQAGTQAMASQIHTLAGLHVRVVELELADDLGQPGPSITAFAHQLAGPAATNPDWIFGVASTALTTTYDPASDLDIYYLLDSTGHITYINSSPAATMVQLIDRAERLT